MPFGNLKAMSQIKSLTVSLWHFFRQDKIDANPVYFRRTLLVPLEYVSLDPTEACAHFPPAAFATGICADEVGFESTVL